MTANVLIVAGPTASGKSSLALDIARAFNGVVINADSMQVYAELRVLTARPSPRDEKRAPHRLYGTVPASRSCSAARWRDLALAETEDAISRGMLPVVCGGTGLYLRALCLGLSPIPEIPPDTRRRLATRLAAAGAVALHGDLAARDPAMAARLEPADGQRILRALEVLEATGRSLAAWREEDAQGPPAGLRFATILLMPPRDALYAACDARLAAMVEQGVLAEVVALTALGLDPGLPAMKALGLREFAAHLAGERSLDEALDEVRQATRRYAKRQMTWFRHQIIADLTVETQYSKSISPKIFAFIRQKVLTGTN
jgi:tRNA dimethylallyltransferase